MQQATAGQSADVLSPPPALPALPALPAPAPLQVQPAQMPQSPQSPQPPQHAQPAQSAIPAIPAIPAIGAEAAAPAQFWSSVPAPDPWEQSIREFLFSDGFQLASFALLFPFAVALARRVWVRNGPPPVTPNLENSPRLQRIEQAIESIALEVERIGEAQRFTTKLLAEREPVAGRLPASPAARRDPGVNTPH